MRQAIFVFVVVIMCGIALAQENASNRTGPSQYAIGRHTFVDVGPPNDYYDIFLVRPREGGAFIQKISLTPVIDACFLPAKIEIRSGYTGESPAALLGGVNPCVIPEKELRRESKRCNDCLVFSGADVAMQVQCGSRTRIVRSGILDKDMFDSKPATPKYTSWTMHLLERLDKAVGGPRPMSEPLFPLLSAETSTSRPPNNVPALRDVRAGKYDALFQGAPDKPSDLYRAAQIPPAIPTVKLSSVTPFEPNNPLLPDYPPIAKAARVEGTVSFHALVAASGGLGDVTFDGGSPLLRGAVMSAVTKWKFSREAFGQTVHATINFALNCPTKSK